MKKGLLRITLPLIVLLLPVIGITLLRCGKNTYKELPHIGIPTGLATNGDTLFHKVSKFSFGVNQAGQSFSSDSLKGKIYVAHFFFTSCPNICPQITKNLEEVNTHYSKESPKDFRIVSFSVDPENDSVPRLKAFAQKFKITLPGWHLLTGPKDSIYTLMGTKGYLVLPPRPSNNPAEFEHSEIVVLVDKQGHVRGQYNGLDEKEIDRLMDEIRLLYLADAAHKNT